MALQTYALDCLSKNPRTAPRCLAHPHPRPLCPRPTSKTHLEALADRHELQLRSPGARSPHLLHIGLLTDSSGTHIAGHVGHVGGNGRTRPKGSNWNNAWIFQLMPHVCPKGLLLMDENLFWDHLSTPASNDSSASKSSGAKKTSKSCARRQPTHAPPTAIGVDGVTPRTGRHVGGMN